MKIDAPSAGGIWISFLTIFLIASSTFLFSFGAPAERTGAPRMGEPQEPTCVDGCHVSFPLNSGEGSVTILAPAEYAPGEIFDVTVRVSDPNAVLFGFEITAKDASAEHVGLWDISGDAVQFSGGSTEYVTHNNAPSGSGSDSFSWTIPWTAPGSDAGDVTFYATGNGADGDGGLLGDRIYATSLTISPVGPTATDETEAPVDFAIDSVFPNPFTGRATIAFTLNRTEEVSLELFDALGRKLGSEILGLQPPGMHEWLISGDHLPTGVIFYRIRAGSHARSGLLILAR